MKTIIAHVLEMAQADIVRHIDSEILDKIKTQDPHPQFSAYILGQEGESHGALILDGEKHPKIKKTWYESAIRGLFERLQVGTKVFHLHDETNEHTGRRPIGEMVGKALEFIGNKLSAIVINYILPNYRGLGLDIASVEADLMISPDADGVIVRDVNNVTGIALANSKYNQPGFHGATLLATVQEFAGGEKTMTIEDVKEFLKTQKTKPSEIFSPDTLKDDPVVIVHIREATAGEYAHRRRTEEDLTKAKSEWEKKEGQYQADLKKANGLALKTTVKEKLKTIMDTKKLTPEQQVFISDEIGNLAIEEEAKIEPELIKRIDDGLKRFDHLAKNVFKTAKTGNGSNKDKLIVPAGTTPNPNDIKESQAFKDLSI